MANVTYYVVIEFDRKKGKLVPGQPQQVPSADAARRRVASRAPLHAGVIAFQRTGDPDTGDFDDAEILSQAGEVDLEVLSG